MISKSAFATSDEGLTSCVFDILIARIILMNNVKHIYFTSSFTSAGRGDGVSQRSSRSLPFKVTRFQPNKTPMKDFGPMCVPEDCANYKLRCIAAVLVVCGGPTP